jgi:peptidoglycan/LPS O-acetylase OafA/YrhL
MFRLETTPFIFTVGLTLFYLGSGSLLTGTLLCDLPRNRFVILVATLGAYSYSISLWHEPVRFWGTKLLEWTTGAPLGFGTRATVYLVGSLAAGVVMARAVELPALRLRDHWFPPLSRGPVDGLPNRLLLQTVAKVQPVD